MDPEQIAIIQEMLAQLALRGGGQSPDPPERSIRDARAAGIRDAPEQRFTGLDPNTIINAPKMRELQITPENLDQATVQQLLQQLQQRRVQDITSVDDLDQFLR